MRRFLLPLVCVLPIAPIAAQTTNYAVDLVNPFVGTGGHGHTFPGACVPNGLVQLSPDTRPDGYNDWDGCGGYHYSDSLIYGFSHTHLSGTGVADLCDVLLMPMSGRYSLKPEEYRSSFRKVNEEAHAGYYHVRLDDPGIDVELTATKRAGMHRYHFPADREAYVVLDLMHRDQLVSATIDPRKPTEVTGERRSSSWARDQRLFYCIQFSRPMENYVLSDKDTDRTGDRLAKPDTSYRGVFFFGDTQGESLLIKVGISAVSIDGARKNLMAEIPAWDFDAARKQAEDAWNAKLGKIQVKGGTPEQQRIFYTALYHCYVAPYIFNDVDGNYRGMDGEVHHADHNVYTVFSLWDTFRALHPLMTILEPDMTNDFIKTFLLHYQQGGKLPVWELWGNETNCMIGYHSVSVIADAYGKGIRGFNAELALKAMVASAMQDDPCLNAYRTRGYISSEDCSESVSKTLEYAYDDWCIAQMADEMLRSPGWDRTRADRLDSLATVFYERSRNWQNLFDPETKFFRPRRNGGFIEPFDPYEVNFHYTEANAWQYSMFVLHDLDYLIGLFGGPEAFTERLDSLFEASSSTSGREQADITGLIGQYAHGNEPSHHMAYLYRSRPRHQKVQNILGQLYHDAEDGLSGNEDCGQMSAWYVMSAMGLYPTAPGCPYYWSTAPLFNEVRITIPGTEGPLVYERSQDQALLPEPTKVTLEVTKDHEYYLNGSLLPPSDLKRSIRDATATMHQPTVIIRMDAALSVQDLVDVLQIGTELKVKMIMATQPPAENAPGDDAFWTSVHHRVIMNELAINGYGKTPSPFRDDLQFYFPVPIISAAAASFKDSLLITVLNAPESIVSVHTANQVSTASTAQAFSIQNTCDVVVTTPGTPTVTAHFTKIDGSRTVKLESTYANQYAAGGDQALVDGLRGGRDFRTGEWQGYQGQDVLATVDLGEVKKLKRAGLSMLQDMGSWIWYPEYVDIAWSMNGKQWSSVQLTHSVDRKAEGGMTQELWTEKIGSKARYIKVMAKNAGPCPEWHPGKGSASWIFLDEILIEAE